MGTLAIVFIALRKRLVREIRRFRPEVVMTNDPLEAVEREVWLKKPVVDPRFKGVLRIDPVLGGIDR